jgi:hypothetical protein
VGSCGSGGDGFAPILRGRAAIGDFPSSGAGFAPKSCGGVVVGAKPSFARAHFADLPDVDQPCNALDQAAPQPRLDVDGQRERRRAVRAAALEGEREDRALAPAARREHALGDVEAVGDDEVQIEHGGLLSVHEPTL